MKVEIVEFPETKVAYIEHRGTPEEEHQTVRKLIAWKLAHRLLDQEIHRSYGLHYGDPRCSTAGAYHVDFCLSVVDNVLENEAGITSKVIPRQRCALARDLGSRFDNKAAKFLCETWLPQSAETYKGAPIIFHYVNVGPNVKAEDMITDVYLPLV